MLIAGFYFFAMVYMIDVSFTGNPSIFPNIKNAWLSQVDVKPNLYWLAEVLYNEYFYLFWMAGLLLLLAMIGAITLTIDVDSRDMFMKLKQKHTSVIRLKRISFWGIYEKERNNIIQ